jgi:hypothetical protein
MGQRLVPLSIPRANVHFCTTSARELNTNMSGRAKTIDTEARSDPFVFAQTRQAKAAIADYAGAQKRRRLHVFEIVGYSVGEGRRNNSVFRISAIHTPAGEESVFAEVFATRQTILALSTRAVQPRNANAISNGKIFDLRTHARYSSDYLMTWNERRQTDW